MFPFRPVAAGLLLLSATTISRAQNIPAVFPEVSSAASLPAEPVASRPVLLRIGVNAARSFQSGRYYGFGLSLPVAVGAEYQLSSKFTLYTQLDADINIFRPNYSNPEQYNRVPSAALGLGARYYYNQAGRARNNRAHGPFVGNYLALEAHTETSRLASFVPRQNSPRLLLLWGAQRRLGQHFLLDLSAGAGLGYFPGRTNFTYANDRFGIVTQLNAGIYFGR